MKCTVEDCDRVGRVGSGLCTMHYQRWWRHGSTDSLKLGRGLPIRDRLLANINIRSEDECWEWRRKTATKYPIIADENGVGRPASRVAYRVLVGPIGDGLEVCHSCDNPQCCNPTHLFLGTHADNMRDMQRKGRALRTHCPEGHAYEGDNIYLSPKGVRHCRECRRRWSVEQYARLRARRRKP